VAGLYRAGAVDGGRRRRGEDRDGRRGQRCACDDSAAVASEESHAVSPFVRRAGFRFPATFPAGIYQARRRKVKLRNVNFPERTAVFVSEIRGTCFNLVEWPAHRPYAPV
jgi:hypothetical protein